MLRRINEKKETIEIPAVRIAEASFPAPFRSGLEYSSPARGTWNIVHTGMLIPEAHEIFVCAAGCLRGVVLTAAEMGTMDRFSTVAVRENNLLDGDMEELVIEGVSDIIGKLPERPPAVLVYTSCVHHFTGVDLDMIYSRLRERFPDIDFTDCYMNPIMRKSGLTPDQLMRSRLYTLLHERALDPGAAAIIGNDIPCQKDSDLYRLLLAAGLKIHEITECRNYEEYQEMAESSVCISYNPDAAAGGDMLAGRLGGIHHYMKFSYDFDEIDDEFSKLSDTLVKTIGDSAEDNKAAVTDTNVNDSFHAISERTNAERAAAGSTDEEQAAAEKFDAEKADPTSLEAKLKTILKSLREEGRAASRLALQETLTLVGNTPIAIDYTFCPRPLGLARLLLDNGFNVTKVYLDVIPGADRPDYEYLREHYPDLILHPTVHASMRFAANKNSDRCGESSGTCASGPNEGSCIGLAIGQKAAYFENTDHFVNVVEGGGMIGYEAVTRTLELMCDAYINKKEMRELVQVKGLGCEVCIR